MKSFILLSICLLFFCKNSSHTDTLRASINGHWHLFNQNNFKNNFFYKLDIKGDTIAILEGLNFIEESSQFKRNIQGNKKQFILWLDGAYENFTYTIQKDSLLLSKIDKENSENYDYFGIKHNKRNCDVINDFFSAQQVAPCLRLAKAIGNDVIIDDLSTVLSVSFGKSKFTNEPVIEFNKAIVSHKDIPLQFEKFKQTVPRDKWNELKMIINIDKNTSTFILNHFFKEIKSIAFAKIYSRTITTTGTLVLREIDSIDDVINKLKK